MGSIRNVKYICYYYHIPYTDKCENLRKRLGVANRLLLNLTLIFYSQFIYVHTNFVEPFTTSRTIPRTKYSSVKSETVKRNRKIPRK